MGDAPPRRGVRASGGVGSIWVAAAFAVWALGISLTYLWRLRTEGGWPLLVGIAVAAGLLVPALAPESGRRRWLPLVALALVGVGLVGAWAILPSDSTRPLRQFLAALPNPTAGDGHRIAAATVWIAAALTLVRLALGWSRRGARVPLWLLLAPVGIAVGLVLLLGGAWLTLLPSVLLLSAALPIGRQILALVVGRADSRGPLAWVVAECLGLGTISLLWLALGLVRLLTPPVLALGVLALLVFAWRELSALAIGLGRLPRALARPIELGPPTLEPGAGALLALLGVVMLVAALAPDLAHDSVTHHLAIAAAFVRQGSLDPQPESVVSYWQIPVQVLYAGLIAWSGPVAAKGLHFGCGVLAVAGTGALATHLTGRPGPGVVAATIVAATSVVWWMAQTAYMDFPLTFYFLATICALVRWSDTDRRGWLVAAGLSAGVAVPSKLTNAVLGPILLAIVAVRERRHPRRLLIALALVAVPALLVWAPWPLRGFWLTGNPAFPWFNQVFRSPLIEPTAVFAGLRFGFGTDPAALASIPILATFTPGHFIEAAELGPHYLALAPLLPLLAFATPGRARAAIAILLGACGVYAVIWAFALMQNTRYLLPILPLLAVLSATAYERVRAWPGGQLIRSATVAAIFLAVIGCSLSFEQSWWLRDPSSSGLPWRVVLGQQSRESWTNRMAGVGALRSVNATYGTRAKILAPSLDNRLYSESPIYFDDVFAILPVKAALAEVRRREDPAAVAAGLRGLGFSHLLVDGSKRELSAPPAQRPSYLRPDFLERFTAPEHVDNGVVLYRLLDAERQPVEGREALRNGGFEREARDALDAWIVEGRPRIDRSGGTARTGAVAVAVDATNRVISEPVGVTPERIYRLRVHARADRPDVEARFWIQFVSEDRRVMGGGQLPYFPDAEYRPFETLATAPAGARSVRVLLQGGSGATPIWVDDVTLTRLSP